MNYVAIVYRANGSLSNKSAKSPKWSRLYVMYRDYLEVNVLIKLLIIIKQSTNSIFRR